MKSKDKSQKKGRSVFRKIWNVISTIILVLVILLVVFIFINRMTGHVPSVFGFTFFRVQTESMTPTLQVGDVIIDKKVPAEEIHKGDIITYDCLSGTMSGKTITHRVIAEPEVRYGKYYFRTQGDVEGAPVDDEITYDQIEGKYLCSVPLLNKLYSLFLSPYGLLAFVGLIVVLFGYEIVSMFISYRKFDKTFDTYTDSVSSAPADSSSEALPEPAEEKPAVPAQDEPTELTVDDSIDSTEKKE